MNIAQRIEIEHRIVKHLIRSLIDQGFLIRVACEDYDTELFSHAAQVEEEVFDLDSVELVVYECDGENHPVCIGCIVLVYGNDGYDVIADYTTYLENAISSTIKLAQEIEEGSA